MANPAACRVALANVELLLQRDFRSEVAQLEKMLRRELLPLRAAPQVADVRVLGAFAVVETVAPVAVADWQAFAVDRGVWLRPFRNYIYLMPPLIIRPDELAQVTGTIRAGLRELLGN